MNSEFETAIAPITAKVVPDDQRLDILPSLFGDYFIQVERSVYVWMERLFPEYQGGFWEFVTLSNGGFYMYPRGEDSATFEFAGEYTTAHGSISLEGAGIVACIFAFGNMCSHAQTEKTQALFGNHFHLLRDYTEGHACEPQILRAID